MKCISSQKKNRPGNFSVLYLWKSVRPFQDDVADDDDEKDAAFLCVPGMTHCNAFCHTDTHKDREVSRSVACLSCHKHS